MPIYEFGCQNCEKNFEKFVRGFNAITSVSCPDCGSEQVQKQMSTFASHVQGGTMTSTSAANCAPSGL